MLLLLHGTKGLLALASDPLLLSFLVFFSVDVLLVPSPEQLLFVPVSRSAKFEFGRPDPLPSLGGRPTEGFDGMADDGGATIA